MFGDVEARTQYLGKEQKDMKETPRIFAKNDCDRQYRKYDHLLNYIASGRHQRKRDRMSLISRSKLFQYVVDKIPEYGRRLFLAGGS
ncbi:unnamed protein product [Didymodactylos carnosus]|uniref:Uncharacterized protein n=1 Tax=Didymodactylos carnosus TaxID=1234261 RepID=A0A814PCG9_9BILA|nr:unnamed protein product [Didymodactylos carnosus]CAF1104352.1 unnamed protein product [Didymodactylos carnosus]CAF3671709.1 unnamed protein product [Didymodactylos carnosus]CAF3869064.1 unnamed protein product [Didymodactylos carnosus]